MPVDEGNEPGSDLFEKIRESLSGHNRILELLKEHELGVALSDGKLMPLPILPSPCQLTVSGTFESPYSGIKLQKPQRCPRGSSNPSDVKRFIEECVGELLPAEGLNDLGCAYAWRQPPNFKRAIVQFERGLSKREASQEIKATLTENLAVARSLHKPDPISFPLDALPEAIVKEIEARFERIREWEEPGLRVLGDSEIESLPWAG